MEEDDVTGDNEMLNSSITEGAVTRALYGDEQGNIIIGCYGDLCDIHRTNQRP